MTIDLAIQEKGVKYTRTYILNNVLPPCVVDAQARAEGGSYDLTVEEIGAEKKASETDEIKVEGAIQLPKNQDAKKKD